MYSNSFQISFYAPSLNILFIKMANKKSAKGPLGTFISLTTGVNLYTFGVALGPPPPMLSSAPPMVLSAPPMFFRFANFSNAYVHTTLDILAFRGFAVRNKKVSLFVKFFSFFFCSVAILWLPQHAVILAQRKTGFCLKF